MENTIGNDDIGATGQKIIKKLIPIDHGLTIPDSLAIQSFDLAWLDFPQAEEPFSAKTLQYIQKLDVDADI